VVAEYLGAHSVLVMRCGEEDVLVEHDAGSGTKAGSTMTFGIKPDEVLVFDRETGKTL